jgi:hypothetical protein
MSRDQNTAGSREAAAVTRARTAASLDVLLASRSSRPSLSPPVLSLLSRNIHTGACTPTLDRTTRSRITSAASTSTSSGRLLLSKSISLLPASPAALSPKDTLLRRSDLISPSVIVSRALPRSVGRRADALRPIERSSTRLQQLLGIRSSGDLSKADERILPSIRARLHESRRRNDQLEKRTKIAIVMQLAADRMDHVAGRRESADSVDVAGLDLHHSVQSIERATVAERDASAVASRCPMVQQRTAVAVADCCSPPSVLHPSATPPGRAPAPAREDSHSEYSSTMRRRRMRRKRKNC